ncbi:MAG: M90 family metallopeptidase [Bacteroidota bacterium]
MLLKIIGVLLLGAALIYAVFRAYDKQWKPPTQDFLPVWKDILLREISYYKRLSKNDRQLFEFKVHEFLTNVKIVGVETTINDVDRLMVAASAVIPIFAFPEWKYKNLDEVLIYPNTFGEDFATKGEGRRILGMVGTGYMERKMILSKMALRKGFRNETDKKNTAIHEFVHLIDKADGVVDGIPRALLEHQYTIPWVDMIERKLEEIVARKSDINPYASTGREEFFAVLSEYFFERPRLLRKKHPQLYEMLEEIFDQDLAAVKRKS